MFVVALAYCKSLPSCVLRKLLHQADRRLMCITFSSTYSHTSAIALLDTPADSTFILDVNPEQQSKLYGKLLVHVC